MALTVCQPSGFAWTSALYPSSWAPGYKDGSGRFLHDFSYAGYHGGSKPIPTNPPGATYNVVTQYGANNSGSANATAAIQRAIDDAGNAGGGIVYLPAGTYAIEPPSGQNYCLRLSKSKVVLRGAGPGQTKLFVRTSNMRSKYAIYASPSSNSWTNATSSSVSITKDLLMPTKTIPVSSVSFAPGDWVIVRGDITSGFISEHNMGSMWTTSMTPQMYYRKVVAVDSGARTITLDGPTRYSLKTRDNARVYKVAPHIAEVGIENLSIGMKQTTKGGLGNLDYKVSGTGAYEVHASRAIFFRHVVNSWIKSVSTYRPSANSGDYHITSNGIELREVRYITVANCDFKKPQYRGEGGNGYLYTPYGNDILITKCIAEKGRHNISHKTLLASGCVIHRCTLIDSNTLPSDFHMHMSVACLIDNVTFIRNSFEARVRPYGSSPMHGHSATQTVFWNSNGQEGDGTGALIRSSQYGWGYIIGTRGSRSNVNTSADSGTSPTDYTEGIGNGSTLSPASLYEDQLARRLGGSGSTTPPPTEPPPTTTPPPTSGGTVVTASADALVRDGSYAGSNFGADAKLGVKRSPHAGSGYSRASYLKFNLSGVTGTITSAKLKVHATAAQAGAPLKVYGLTNDTWTETGITWNNRPLGGSLLVNTTLSTSGTLSYDVTSYIKGEAAGDKTAGFCLTDTLGLDKLAEFSSREGSNKPVLELVVQ